MNQKTWIAPIGLLLAILAVIVAVTIPQTLFGASPDGAVPNSSPSYQSWPAPGIYAFLDWPNLNPADYPFLTGGHEVVTWSGVERNAQGQYYWGWLDRWIADNAAYGKPVGIGFNTYDGQCCSEPDGHWLPGWYLQTYPDGYITCENDIILPKYWSAAYLSAFGNWVRAAAARYDNDPRVAWVEISHGIYGETEPAENTFNACLSAAGLTSDLWVQTVNTITDLYLDAWHNKPLLIQYAPYFVDRLERRRFTDYAGALGVGMKHNKLLVDHNDQQINNPDYYFYRAGQYDPMLTFEGQVPMSWEAYRLHYDTPADTLWGFLNGMDKHPTYVLVTRALLQTTDPLELEVLDFVHRYSGRTLDDTPGVWVALRETEQTWYPQRGNFDFWLYQNDEVAGGLTVPQWRVTGYPHGRYTRRTDQNTGNPYMYFDVDNGYLYDTTKAVTVTITYLDQGTDAWELHYDGPGNEVRVADRIHKTNSGTWRKASFRLADAQFADGLPGGGSRAGSDFRIWSAGDGDEFVHFVEVVRSSDHAGSGVTPTPTRPSTPSPTPTPAGPPTPTPLPTPVVPPPALSARHVAQAPAIDGDLADWPQGDTWLLDQSTASYVHVRSSPDPEGASARLQVTWNETTLFVAAVISDSHQVADSLDVWMDDGIELGIDAYHDRVSGGNDDHQLTATVDERLTDFGIHAVAGAQLAVQQLADHYVLELAIPAATLNLPDLAAGQTLGINLGLHDDDDGGSWDTYLIRAGDSTITGAASWGILTLQPPLTYSIGGHTWYDLNGNGMWELSENDFLGGVTIGVQDASNATVAVVQSSDDGIWQVHELPPGDYTVLAELPPGVIATTRLEAPISLPGTTEVDFGFLGSTAVTLQRFDAESYRHEVVLRWETAIEVDNDGFLIYRQAQGSTIVKPLTLSPLPSQAAPGGGAAYRFHDDLVSAGQRYTYWIETVPGGDQFGPLVVVTPLAMGNYRLFVPGIR